ncbi:hypothetical protein ACFL4G_10710, partial [Thermodesulfobacteriota bacterium]
PTISHPQPVQYGLPEESLGTHRLRLMPKLTFAEKYSLNLEMDVFDGLVYNKDRSDRFILQHQEKPMLNKEGTQIDSFELTRIWADIETPVGLIRAGRQGSDWGIGMLANGGNGFDDDFGDNHFGSTVDRVLFATKPFSVFKAITGGEKPANDPLTLALAYDWSVYEDPSANEDDDDVGMFVGALLYETEPVTCGLYAVYRDQDHEPSAGDLELTPPGNRPPNEYLEAVILDVFGRLNFNMSDDLTLFAEGEIAYITGDTTLTTSIIESDPYLDLFPESDVEQLGWVAKVGLRYLPYRQWLQSLEGDIEAGYASGDDNPFDDEVRAFSFHPDYNVGFILFEEVLAAQSATSAFKLLDTRDVDDNFGGPVKTPGADLLPSDGAVTNAIYVKETLRYRPVERLETILSILYARAAQDVVDPFNDGNFKGGFGTVNPQGGPASNREYGWEIDFGVSYTLGFNPFVREPDERGIGMVVGLQAGHLFVGDAFEDSFGNKIDDVSKIQGRLTILW